MRFKQSYDKLLESKEFKQWREKNKKDYLAHGFYMDDEVSKNEWQIGFYNKEKDKMTTFSVFKERVEVSKEAEIFKKPEAKIEELKVEEIKISSDEGFKIADKIQKEKYSSDLPQKRFMIIQNLEGKTVFNITMLTATFEALNLRISCSTGKILLEKITPLMNFRAE